MRPRGRGRGRGFLVSFWSFFDEVIDSVELLDSKTGGTKFVVSERTNKAITDVSLEITDAFG